MLVNRWIQPLRNAFGRKEQAATPERAPLPEGAILEETFPCGYHVYGFADAPGGDGRILVGAGDPTTSTGGIYLGRTGGPWTRAEIPEDTALISHFERLSDGTYLAGGMNSIGRGVLLRGDKSAMNWFPVDFDLHPYASVASLLSCPDGTLLASLGLMKTQGKTLPILLRSPDGGATWAREETKLPVTLFQSFELAPDGTLFIGTAGDSLPILYRSPDLGRTFETLPSFPAYKTYKMLWLRHITLDGVGRLLVLLWGYKTEIADRVVRFYVSTPSFDGWEELPPIEDSHFIFSALVARSGDLLVGSEKGRVYRSADFGLTWRKEVQFSTNIGAYALHEDPEGNLWVGKDYVSEDRRSLWRLAGDSRPASD